MSEPHNNLDVSPDGEQSLDGIRLGALGEWIAARKLEEEGYKIVAQNERIRGGELDIIALDGDVLAFVEVKTRVRAGVFKPRDNITFAKKKQIRALAAAYVRRNSSRKKLTIRYDVVEVIVDAETLSASDVKLHKRFFD